MTCHFRNPHPLIGKTAQLTIASPWSVAQKSRFHRPSCSATVWPATLLEIVALQEMLQWTPPTGSVSARAMVWSEWYHLNRL